MGDLGYNSRKQPSLLRNSRQGLRQLFLSHPHVGTREQQPRLSSLLSLSASSLHSYTAQSPAQGVVTSHLGWGFLPQLKVKTTPTDQL